MALESQVEDLLDLLYSANRYRIIKIICQTLVYGVYLCLAPIAVHVIITKGLQSRSRKWLFAMTTSMFALSTLYWIFSVVFTFIVVDLVNNTIRTCYGGDPNAFLCIAQELGNSRRPTGSLLAMFDDVVLINYIIADSVVVWRAWVLCPNRSSRVVLMVPVGLLAINTAIYLTIIVLRTLALIAIEEAQSAGALSNTIDVAQVAHLALSLLINILATSIIALKAWRLGKLRMESGIGSRSTTNGIRILALVVESGIIHILNGVIALISITVFLKFGLKQISTIILPVAIQLVGIYPIVVVLLVEQNRSLNSTYSSFTTVSDVHGVRPSQTDHMSFAPGPVLASGGRIDLATKSASTDIRITLNSARLSQDSEADRK